MYNDLAEAVEDLKAKGIESLTEEMAAELRAGRAGKIREYRILETHRFDTYRTNPEDESTLYVLELPDKSKRYLVLSFGMYQDPEKSRLIDDLKKMEE